jgi:hypothetical protein
VIEIWRSCRDLLYPLYSWWFLRMRVVIFVVEDGSSADTSIVSSLPSSYHHLLHQKLVIWWFFPDKKWILGLVCSILKLLFLPNNEEIEIMLYRTKRVGLYISAYKKIFAWQHWPDVVHFTTNINTHIFPMCLKAQCNQWMTLWALDPDGHFTCWSEVN